MTNSFLFSHTYENKLRVDIIENKIDIPPKVTEASQRSLHDTRQFGVRNRKVLRINPSSGVVFHFSRPQTPDPESYKNKNSEPQILQRRQKMLSGLEDKSQYKVKSVKLEMRARAILELKLKSNQGNPWSQLNWWEREMLHTVNCQPLLLPLPSLLLHQLVHHNLLTRLSAPDLAVRIVGHCN